MTNKDIMEHTYPLDETSGKVSDGKVNDENKLVPANGVYAVEMKIANAQSPLLKGMMNIGYRPTVGGTKRMIEVNIFDFGKEIYGEQLRAYLRKYLREEKKFNGLEELKNQLAIDKVNALKGPFPSTKKKG